jgi:S-adenosylmethionine decarboxylase
LIGGEALEQSPVGTHCILELHGCSFAILNDVLFVRNAVKRASSQGLATLLKLTSHKFEPHGVTAVGLLAESHLSIHTWPEHGYAAIDIFTCGEDADPRQACTYLVNRFGAREHKLLVLRRGMGVEYHPLDHPSEPFEEHDRCRVPV